MNKLLLLLAALISPIISSSQVVLSNHFDGYNGLTSSVEPGWYYSWNDTASTSRSYYISASTCGQSCPAYKFGQDSVTIITPYFSGADSVRFYFKGNGSTHDSNTFYVYGSADSVSWALIAEFDSISLTTTTKILPVGPTFSYLKFFYSKLVPGLNAGVDDIYIYQGSFDGIEEVPLNQISIFPNPAKTEANIRLNGNVLRNATITVMNLIGKEMLNIHADVLEGNYLMDIRNLDSGIYFIRIKADKAQIVQRLIVER